MTENLVTVGTYPTSLEAQLAKNRLQAAGIPAILLDGEVADMAWYLTNAVGGVKLQVQPGAAEQARAVLARVHSGEENAPSGEQTADEGMEMGLLPGGEVPEDEEEESQTGRERDAERAWRGAVLGLLFFPFQLYVFWLLLKVFVSNDPLGPRFRRLAWGAALLNLPFIIGFCLILRFILA
jgi:hypothetical protein